MKNKFFILAISVMILMSCASTESDEAEPAEVILYRMAQDRMNAQNFMGAVESLARIERFYPFGVYAEQARADLIYAHYMTGDYDQAYAASEKFIRLYPRNTNIDYAYFMKGMTGYYADDGLLGNLFSLSRASVVARAPVEMQRCLVLALPGLTTITTNVELGSFPVCPCLKLC